MITNEEKETIINFNEAEKTASVYTMNPKLLKQLTQLVEDGNEDITIHKKYNDGAIDFYVPKKWIKVKPPTKRVLTDEQKKALADRLANSRKS